MITCVVQVAGLITCVVRAAGPRDGRGRAHHARAPYPDKKIPHDLLGGSGGRVHDLLCGLVGRAHNPGVIRATGSIACVVRVAVPHNLCGSGGRAHNLLCYSGGRVS